MSPHRLAATALLLALQACSGGGSDEKPVARLRTPVVADAQLPVTLDAQRSRDPDGTIVRFTYTFGDGTPSVTWERAQVEHVFVGPGRFEMALEVEDDRGNTNRLTRAITLVDRLSTPYCTAGSGCEPEQQCDTDAGVCWEETP